MDECKFKQLRSPRNDENFYIGKHWQCWSPDDLPVSLYNLSRSWSGLWLPMTNAIGCSSRAHHRRLYSGRKPVRWESRRTPVRICEAPDPSQFESQKWATKLQLLLVSYQQWNLSNFDFILPVSRFEARNSLFLSKWCSFRRYDFEKYYWILQKVGSWRKNMIFWLNKCLP